MLAFKAVLYSLTAGSMFFFGGWEMWLKRRLTEKALEQQPENVRGHWDVLYSIKKDFRCERILQNLPPEALRKYKMAVILKFLFMVILAVEVIFLQR